MLAAEQGFTHQAVEEQTMEPALHVRCRQWETTTMAALEPATEHRKPAKPARLEPTLRAAAAPTVALAMLAMATLRVEVASTAVAAPH